MTAKYRLVRGNCPCRSIVRGSCAVLAVPAIRTTWQLTQNYYYYSFWTIALSPSTVVHRWCTCYHRIFPLPLFSLFSCTRNFFLFPTESDSSTWSFTWSRFSSYFCWLDSDSYTKNHSNTHSRFENFSSALPQFCWCFFSASVLCYFFISKSHTLFSR